MSSRRLSIGLLSATAISYFLIAPASADVDGKALADALVAQFSKQGVPLTIGSTEVAGDNVVAKDITVKFPDSEPFKIAQVVLEDVVEEEDGGYTIGSIAAPATTIEKEGNKVEFGGASIEGLFIPDAEETDPIAALGLYEAINVEPINVSVKGAEVFRMESMTASMSAYEEGKPFAFEASVDGLWGDLSKIEDPQAQKTLAEFGYKELTGDVKMKGSWNPEDGRMTVTEGAYNIVDVGKLNVTFDLSGYTPALVKGLQEMNKNMEGQDESAKGLAMLGLLQQLNFIGMTIRFDDASITNKGLDYAAKQSGVDRPGIIAQTKGILPFGLAMLKDPDFSTKVTAAVSAYLDAPKNLEVKAAPAAPVPFALLVATGSTTPEALIKQLNVSVTANQ